MTARHFAQNAAFATLLVAGSASLAAAQPSMRGRGPNPDAPKLMVSACHTPDKILAVQCADRIRSEIEGAVSFRTLSVMAKADVENTLTASGYDPSVGLAPGDAIALAKQLKADYYINASVEKVGAGYKINAAAVLSRDANMAQPLGVFEAPKFEDAAKLVSRAFSDALSKTGDNQKACFTMGRERKYADAAKEAAAGLKDYPKSAWLRYCQLGLMKDQKAPAAEITKLVEEIRDIDPQSKAAWQELVMLYDAAGNKEKKVEALMALRAADPTNARLTADIVNDLAAMGQFDKARPLAEKGVAENPGNIDLIRPYWLILMNAKEYKTALSVGKQMATMDSATADTAYFYKMIGAANADSNFAEAADLSSKAALKYPSVADFPLYAVTFYRKAGDNAKSLAAAKSALAANPKLKDLRASVAAALLAENPPKFNDAIAMVKDMIVNGEDKNQIAGIAVQAGNVMRTWIDTLKAKGADATALKATTLAAYATTAWADTLAKGTTLEAQGKFVMGVTALSVGQLFLTEAGDIGRKLSDDIKAQKPDAAKQKAMIDEAYPRACALANQANDYFVTAQGAVPAGGRFNPQAAQQVMGSLMTLNGYVEQMTKAYCKK